MKTLEEYISEIVSPYDEDVSDDQIELNEKGYTLYQQDLIINPIGQKENRNNVNLFLSDILNELNKENKQIFLKKILYKLIDVYFLNYLSFFDEIKSLSFNYQNEIIELLIFLESDLYYESISQNIPSLSIEINNHKLIEKFVIDNVFIIKEQIKNNVKYPFLLNVFFNFASLEDFIKFFTVILNKDVLSIVVKQKERKL